MVESETLEEPLDVMDHILDDLWVGLLVELLTLKSGKSSEGVVPASFGPGMVEDTSE